MNTRRFFLLSTMVLTQFLASCFGFGSSEKPEQFFEGSALELGQAIYDEDLSAIENLAAVESTLNDLHKQDMTFLHYAVLRKNFEAMRVLLVQGADPLLEVEGLGSVMFVGSKAKDLQVLETLLAAGVDPNSTDNTDWPYFFNGDLEHLKLFKQYGANFDLPSSSGRTALMQYFTGLQYDEVQYLLEQGADPTLAANNGVTLQRLFELEMEQQQVDTSTAAYQTLKELEPLIVDQ